MFYGTLGAIRTQAPYVLRNVEKHPVRFSTNVLFRWNKKKTALLSRRDIMWVGPDRINAAYVPSERLVQIEFENLAFLQNMD